MGLKIKETQMSWKYRWALCGIVMSGGIFLVPKMTNVKDKVLFQILSVDEVRRIDASVT